MNKEEALKKLQEAELEILLGVADFCKAHQITWFLDSGTALGAVRHGGFIPWDDDIDIGMLREDYDRFLELVEREGLPEGLSLHTFENTYGYAGMFAKIYLDGTEFLTAETIYSGCEQGIFIDIFPYDKLASDDALREKQINNAQLWKDVSFLYHSPIVTTLSNRGLVGALAKGVCVCVHHLLTMLVDRNSIRNNFERSHLELMPSGDLGNGKRIVFMWASKLQFDEGILIPTTNVTFCGYELPVPGNVEKYLEMSYGNWSEIPDPEHRHTHLPQRLVYKDGTCWTLDK